MHVQGTAKQSPDIENEGISNLCLMRAAVKLFSEVHYHILIKIEFVNFC